jgi:hypothetical protein
MKQYEAVIKVMKDNGGYATLGFLYQHVLKIKGCEWKTKTPFASIRRIVQDERFFFKIRPGLWALKSFKENLPLNVLPAKEVSKSKQQEFNHTYYQGLLVEIGNLKKFKTFVPNQDKNKIYLDKRLGDAITVKKFYEFGYDHIIRKTSTIDVSWFNDRKMPDSLFEVEYSTNIQDSLLKFVELQDYNVRLFIVADRARERDFNSKKSLSAFSIIRERVKFLSYDKLSSWHSGAYELISLENNL